MNSKFSTMQKLTAFLMLAAMFSPVFSINAGAQQMTASAQSKALTENQKILHVLNRLGFGARPGDVERVKGVGLNRYIEQQLNPASINDSLAEAKVQNIDILKMSNEEIFAKYPSQKVALQIVAQRNGLNPKQLSGELKELRKDNKSEKNGEMGMETDAAKNPPATPDTAQMTDEQRRDYQRQVAQVYRESGFRRPAEISQQLTASRILRAAYSERQLNEVMVDFWTNHFNVFAGKGAVRWLLPGYDRDVIRPNALGNFKDLLAATAKSPAMLFYLDNFQSVAENANQMGGNNRRAQRLMQNGGQINERQKERMRARGMTDEQIEQRAKQMSENPQANQPKRKRGINENYARELMELHTLGVEGGYTQKDIGEVARAFTGWTIIDPRGYRNAAGQMGEGGKGKRAMKGMMRLGGLPADAESGTFFFNERTHDGGEKIVLGQKVDEGGMNDGLKVIDILVNHPSTAKFIARKLAVKFVSDNPSEALVQRVADAFHNSKGDIKTTLRALFTDKEFFAPENYRAKIKTPFEVVVSAIRTVGADTNGGQVQAMLAKMGEPLYGYQAPTGYPDMAEDWVNTGALLERMNFSIALASNRIPGTKVNLSKFEGKNKQEILGKAIAEILEGEISANTRAMLLEQLEHPLPEPQLTANSDEMMVENASMERPAGGQGGGKRGAQQARLLPPSGNAEVFKVIGLILGSPDFQRQ